jgi:hypothetical protein
LGAFNGGGRFPSGQGDPAAAQNIQLHEIHYSRNVNKVIIPEMCRRDNSGLIAEGVHYTVLLMTSQAGDDERRERERNRTTDM